VTVDARPDPLAPVRAALLAAAHRHADRLLAEADEDAKAELAAANRWSDAMRAEAKAQGTADAESVAGAEITKAHREARTLVMQARRAAHDELRARVRKAVVLLRDDPAYDSFLERAGERARAVLGDDVVLEEHPAGGVVAVAGPRRASYTLEALAEHVLDEMATELEGLWTP
jgi:vacuolar-type H+-ATPase subunit E/Vma4